MSCKADFELRLRDICRIRLTAVTTDGQGILRRLYSGELYWDLSEPVTHTDR